MRVAATLIAVFALLALSGCAGLGLRVDCCCFSVGAADGVDDVPAPPAAAVHMPPATASAKMAY